MKEIKITEKDLIVLTIMTDYLFCDNIRDVLEFASSMLNKRINAFDLHERKNYSTLKGLLWDDFLKIKRKLKDLAK